MPQYRSFNMVGAKKFIASLLRVSMITHTEKAHLLLLYRLAESSFISSQASEKTDGARDALADAIERLEAAGFPIVFHVHDEVIIDIKPFAEDKAMLQAVTDIMTQPIPWAPGLPLGADGWVGDFFTKD